MSRSPEPPRRTEIYVGGAWRTPHGDGVLSVEDPFTQQPLPTVPAGDAADVDAAVAAARAAFEPWAALGPAERSAYLGRLHELLTERADALAALVSLELGTPLKISQRVQIGLPLAVLGTYVRLAAEQPPVVTAGNSTVFREPIGVVGAITPWNYPLHQVMAKVAAALAAGCTVVLKPSELTPHIAYALFDAVHAAGFPPGVVNLVPGTGPGVGEAIAGHPDVDMVSFTGSTAVGRRISHLAADRIAKVALELGGKSANVILPGADLAKAVKTGVANAYLNAGQTCTAWTRMLVHHDHHDEAVELAAAAAKSYAMGDPFDSATRLGPLASAAQRDRVRGFIETALAEGARRVTETGGLPETGYFVEPTVLAGVRPDATVAREEVFGPVLSVIPFADDDEAVAIANSTRYGLAGAVWCDDEDRALAVARRMRTGAVDVNGAAFNPVAPFGGYKQSGLGRELGSFGLEEFWETKAVQR
ncbi:aldehyde dehydrogenase family protein [Hamadaea tsunoensis]|uniref:aldehyde dehydrogenase family protein n=1 Tax=Hamadaea tsunoensis TaxID=53368 RepID=UPI000410D178|nr:aldehyde dehydrogenase family protein [Hamadaea tsunoensis]